MIVMDMELVLTPLPPVLVLKVGVPRVTLPSTMPLIVVPEPVPLVGLGRTFLRRQLMHMHMLNVRIEVLVIEPLEHVIALMASLDLPVTETNVPTNVLAMVPV